jgi:ABC-2 type transport system permease protein
VNVGRVTTLVGKELREFRANASALLPLVIVILVCTVIPFVVTILVPRLTGETLSGDAAMRPIIERALQSLPSLQGLPLEAAGEAFLLQQFLLLFLIAPIIGAVSLASYAVVGEKQGRTLEPLLTTPLTTGELLVAKAVASFLPSFVAAVAGVALYLLLVTLLAAPGVLATLLTARTFVLVGVLGPFSSLAALQATIAVSSRVNDPRSAQQIAVLLVMPLVAMLVAQIAGAFFVSTAVLLLLSLAVAGVWGVLIMFSVALFERETILTRWK